MFRNPSMPSRLAAAAIAVFASTTAAHAEQIVGLTTTNSLLTFDSATPINGTSLSSISGLLAPNERILSIDLRPTTGVLYGVSSENNVYSLLTSGAATFIGALSTPLLSDVLGIDFNPEADRLAATSLRIVSSTGQNLAFNIASGATAVQTPIQSNFTSVAYANNDVSAATGTALYYIDATSDVLKVATGAFNAPTITTVGALGLNANGVNGFDISGTGAAFAAVTDADTGKSGLYAVNLGTGALTFAGEFGIGGNTAISPPLLGLTVGAVPAIPEPETYALMLVGLAVVGAVARRKKQTSA